MKTQISTNDIEFIKQKINESNAKFITINNLKNNDFNNYILKDINNIFISDVNVQLKKTMKFSDYINENIFIENNLEENIDIVNIASNSFIYSRFINDPNLPENKYNVYSEWVKNSFNNNEKYFCYYKQNDKIAGFILFSINNNEKSAVIELIGVDKENKNNGIGKKMICSMEKFLYNNDIEIINVGTQINNVIAQNFYLKCGFKHDHNNSIYHLWLEC